MADANEKVTPELPASEMGQDTASSADPVQSAEDDTAGLPDWARRQMAEAPDASSAGDAGSSAIEAAEEGTSGLPDWAVQKLTQMDTDDATPASTPDAPSDGGGGLPSWAVQKMQEFADSEADGGEAPATAAPIAAAPTTTSVIAGAQPADAGPQISPQFAQYAPNLELMLDLPLDVSVELGHAELPLAHVLGLKAGSVVQLDKLPGEPLDLLVNGQLVARGEIVVLNDTFAFRITDLIED